MNPILNYLGTKGKDLMAQVITTEASEHPLPESLIYLGDVPYTGSDGTQLAVDVYRPKDISADPLPVVMFVHGGGLFVGSRKANRTFVELVAERGYVVFVPEYRLIDKTDGIGAISDVCTAFSYLKRYVAEFGGDPKRILVVGESAGAFLSLYATALSASPQLRAMLGIDARELAVRGLACFGGMFYTTGHNPIGLVYRRDMYGERLQNEYFMTLMNPEDPRVVSSLPPVFLVTSGADFLKSQTLRYDKALEMAGHDHRLVYYQQGKELVHAFPSLQPGLPQSKEVLDALEAWFKGL